MPQWSHFTRTTRRPLPAVPTNSHTIAKLDFQSPAGSAPFRKQLAIRNRVFSRGAFMANSSRNPNSITTIKCAGPGCCNTTATTGRWFITLVEHESFFCRRYSAFRPLRPPEKPACGQACAVRLFDRFLTFRNVAGCPGTTPIANHPRVPAALSTRHRKLCSEQSPTRPRGLRKKPDI